MRSTSSICERRTMRTVTNLAGSSFFPSWTQDGRLVVSLRRRRLSRLHDGGATCSAAPERPLGRPISACRRRSAGPMCFLKRRIRATPRAGDGLGARGARTVRTPSIDLQRAQPRLPRAAVGRRP